MREITLENLIEFIHEDTIINLHDEEGEQIGIFNTGNVQRYNDKLVVYIHPYSEGCLYVEIWIPDED